MHAGGNRPGPVQSSVGSVSADDSVKLGVRCCKVAEHEVNATSNTLVIAITEFRSGGKKVGHTSTE